MNASKSMSVRISVVVFAVLMALMLSLILSSQGAATAVAVAPDPDLQRSFSRIRRGSASRGERSAAGGRELQRHSLG
jgi:hypothetical protein